MTMTHDRPTSPIKQALVSTSIGLAVVSSLFLVARYARLGTETHQTAVSPGGTETLSSTEIDRVSRSMVALECTSFETQDGRGVPVFGTGTYLTLPNPGAGTVNVVLTNAHVAQKPPRGPLKLPTTKTSCTGRFNQVNKDHYYYFLYSYADSTAVLNGDHDFAVAVPEANNGIDNEVKPLGEGGQPLSFCKTLEVGKRVYVFGYPSSSDTFTPTPEPDGRLFSAEWLAWMREIERFSASRNLVLTDGIISGSRGPDYFTTAKIDAGNSGGLVVSKEEGRLCLVGVPTWVSVGEFENLGVIQPMTGLFQSGIDFQKLSEPGFSKLF